MVPWEISVIIDTVKPFSLQIRADVISKNKNGECLMNDNLISQLCVECFSTEPSTLKRFSVGTGNYVYRVECAGTKYVIRCTPEANAYDHTIHWLSKLKELRIPVPEVIAHGRFEKYDYLILSYIEGSDIGLVYPQLSDTIKRDIAKGIVHIQSQVALLDSEEAPPDWSWNTFVTQMLDRAEKRIVKNGYFDVNKVRKLREQASALAEYFSTIQPTAYLDDISSKNLIIHNGQISGIIDVDWMGFGDRLTYVALTNVALLNLEYDTDYVAYILEEMRLSQAQKRAFQFYSLMYCVDFMGERGSEFLDRTVEVNQEIIDRLNGIYDMLWNEWVHANKN